MLEKSFLEVYDKFKLQFYRKVFEHVRERDGSLSAMEGFSLEVIQILGEPTVSEFADFLNISQSNATYKVNNLIKKGYLERANSQVDRREYHLILSEKYYSYLRMFTNYEQKVVERMKVRRRAMKVSQQELARRSGVSYASIRRFETTGEIAFLSLLKIALALDCLEDFTSLFHKPEPQNLKDL